MGRIIVPGGTKWHKEAVAIYFSVVSRGFDGAVWFEHLKKQGYDVGGRASQALNSSDFKPTEVGTVHHIAMLRGSLFPDGPVTKDVRAEADRRGLLKPSAEVACLIREKFTNRELKDMGVLWAVVMHEPIKDSDGFPSLLFAASNGDKEELGAFFDEPDRKWCNDDAFVFVAPS